MLLRKYRSNLLLSRLNPFLEVQMPGCFSGEDVGRSSFCSATGVLELSECRKVNSKHLGITCSMIPAPSWTVLRILKHAGYRAYLVGGCVRDLILNKVPKDFDVITTATLIQVKQTFRRALIVGRRFPICRVTLKGTVVEVSSFETASEQSIGKQVDPSRIPEGYDQLDFIRWKNCLKRDFTVNSLFFDPYRNVIFDYADAMTDLRSLKLRTIKPSELSFKEDEARILRGLRLAARLNLLFSKETEAAINSLYPTVANLDTSRIRMEMNYMFSYGAAEPSVLLLKRFKILEILLPYHAAYLSEQEDNGFCLQSTMLMKLFFNMDQLTSCDRPCNDSLWIAILAFHQGLFSNPDDPVVVLTFASLLYHGTWDESIKFARKNVEATQICMPEILDTFKELSDVEISERVAQLARRVEDSVDVLVKMDCLSEAMARFQGSSCSGLVFVSNKTAIRVKHIFEVLTKDVKSLKNDDRSMNKDYCFGEKASSVEIGFVLGKIILETLVGSGISEVQGGKVKADVQAMDSGAFLVQNKRKRMIADSNNKQSEDSASNATLFLDKRQETWCSESRPRFSLSRQFRLVDLIQSCASFAREETMPQLDEEICIAGDAIDVALQVSYSQEIIIEGKEFLMHQNENVPCRTKMLLHRKVFDLDGDPVL